MVFFCTKQRAGGAVASFVVGLCLSFVLMRGVRIASRHTGREVSATQPSTPTTMQATERSNGLVNLTATALTSKEKNEVLLLVLIFSQPVPSAQEMRNSIRESWGKELDSHSNAHYKFVIPVGKPVDDEVSVPSWLAEEHHTREDVLLISQDITSAIPSHYLLSTLEWSLANIKFTYLLRVTDASFVKVDTLLKELETYRTSFLVWGYFVGNQAYSREGLHSEKKWNLCATFLPYPEGGGFILSYDLIKMLVDMAPDLQYMDNDDTAIGVWIAPFTHINRRHDRRFNTGLKSRGCLNSYLVTHPETAESMKEKHQLYKSKGILCEKEQTWVKDYEYNWNVPVDKCCIPE